MTRPRAVMAWSSGKDSAWALHTVRRAAELDIVGVLTTVTADYGRVSMHGVRAELLAAQARALGLPLHRVDIPADCPEDVYAARMSGALAPLAASGVTSVIFGDLYLEGIREYRVSRLGRVGMTASFPLWARDTDGLAAEMIAGGLKATLTCVDPRCLDREFAGRAFDAALLAGLPGGVDPCGENGEFHTVLTDGPMFASAIPVRGRSGRSQRLRVRRRDPRNELTTSGRGRPATRARRASPRRRPVRSPLPCPRRGCVRRGW